MNPLARSIEELLPDTVAESTWSFYLIRAALVASNVCVAFAVPFFGEYFRPYDFAFNAVANDQV